MPTSIWSGQPSHHLRLSVLFHDDGCKKFKKYVLKRNLKWNVTTQPCPQSNFFSKNKKVAFSPSSFNKRMRLGRGNKWQSNKKLFFKELFILFVTNQRSHVKSVKSLRKGTLVFFKIIYRNSNLRALSSIFKIYKNMFFFFSYKKYFRAFY